jgi:hypothetical protein
MKGNRRDEITFVEARATSERALGQTDASGGDRGGGMGSMLPERRAPRHGERPEGLHEGGGDHGAQEGAGGGGCEEAR